MGRQTLPEQAISKEQLLRDLAAAFERLIAAATEASQVRTTRPGDNLCPREVVAHLAGWEIMATVRIPYIAAGMAPLEETPEEREKVMNAAINAAFTALVGNQPIETVCDILRQAYRRDIAMLQTLDDTHFQPGTYVYERTRGVIEHCQEHGEQLSANRA